jgi:uncharacterized protein (DUF58 family)
LLDGAITRRVRHHVTRGGALFALALLLTGAGAFLSANNLLFLVFSSMLALLLVSGFLSRLVLAGLELELLLPEHVCARTATSALVRIRNLKRLTPSFSIELAGRSHPLSSAPSILATPVYFPLIPGRSFVEARVPVTFPWRGRHHENLFVLSTKFPFGFLRKTARVTLRRETIVYPSLEPSNASDEVLERVTGEIDTQFRGSGLDFYRIRPYEMTDNARLVDWKSTAHTGELQVREFSREENRAVEIFLDRRVSAERTERFEQAVQQCAYIVWELTDRDIAVKLRSQEMPGLDDVYEILRFLALVQVLAGRINVTDEVDPPHDPSGPQIVFTQYPQAFADAGWNSAA